MERVIPQRVAVFGGDGGGAVVAQSIRRISAARGELELIGFLNDVIPAGRVVEGVPVLGPFDSWADQPHDVAFVAPLHRVKLMEQRVRRIAALGIPADRWATVFDPEAAIAGSAEIGVGCCVGPFATLMPGAQLGDHAVVRNGACVGHDSKMGDYVFVGANAVVSGYVTVARGAYIAPGAVVRERLSIGQFAVVGLGAVVLEDVADHGIVAGNPAHQIGRTGSSHV